MFRFLAVALACLLSTTSLAAETKQVKLNGNNTLLLRSEVNATSVNAVVKGLASAPNQDFYLYINSLGGSVFDGLQLIRAIKAHKGHVTCLLQTGASMAFSIFEACGTRLIYADSVLMQHEPSFGAQPEQVHHVVSFVNFLLRSLTYLNTLDANRLGIPLDKFQALIAKDYWLFGQEAIDAHAADAYADVTCTKSLIDTTYTERVNGGFLTVQVSWSSCPLITAPVTAEAKDVAPGHSKAEIDAAVKKVMDGLMAQDMTFTTSVGTGT